MYPAWKLVLPCLIGVSLLSLNACNSSATGGDASRARPDAPVGSSPAASVPVGMAPTAALVDPGQRSTLAFSPDRGGRIYLYDVAGDAIVYNGPLLANQKFTVDPASNRARIDAERVDTDRELKSGRQYQLWFNPRQNATPNG